MARLFKENGQEVVLVDANLDHCTAAGNDCARVLCANGLEARTLLRAEIDTRRGALALTPNDEVNYLFVQKVKEETREVPLYAALKSETASLTPAMLHDAGVDLLFGATVDVEAWDRRITAGKVFLQRWRRDDEEVEELRAGSPAAAYSGSGLVLAAVFRGAAVHPAGDSLAFKEGDELLCFVFDAERESAAGFLEKAGWRCIETVEKEGFSTSVCHPENTEL